MTCQTAVNVASSHSEKRVDSPRAFCNSPSSISDVDFSRCTSDRATSSSDKISESNPAQCNAKSGDELENPQNGLSALCEASLSVVINEALAHPVSSSQSLKRKAGDSVDNEREQQLTKKAKTEKIYEPTVESESDYLPTDIEEEEEVTYDRVQAESRDNDDGYDASGCVGMVSAADVECSNESPCQVSRRTLYIEYWSRTDECKERKWDHLDEIAENYGSAEEHIFTTTLKGIEHWTLWHVKDLDHEQVKQYVESWINANAPHVDRWNYDDNPERSIDIFHVHVYFQVAEGLTVLQDRKVDELVHELD